MEYCDGGSLLDLMEVCEITFNEKEIVNITKEILVALDYMHQTIWCIEMSRQGIS
eukprot:TRINITY_DN3365_c0_g1_i1.p1 TRINITY_DN3365_c0_g1~~TRINITY_DN3365_c0_g1_i1.p1  ORF type:complete len:55 (+),score=4.05 TRINITY_DN3365_c0_g1_i1:285-449(+)